MGRGSGGGGRSGGSSKSGAAALSRVQDLTVQVAETHLRRDLSPPGNFEGSQRHDYTTRLRDQRAELAAARQSLPARAGTAPDPAAVRKVLEYQWNHRDRSAAGAWRPNRADPALRRVLGGP